MSDDFPDQLESARLRQLVAQLPDPSNRHVVASAAILRAYKLLSARVEAEIEVLGLTIARHEVLGLLASSPAGVLSPTELSRATLLHPATMTHTVNALEKRKLVRRRSDPSDKRVLLVEITPLGRKAAQVANQALAKISFGVADLSDDDAAEVAIRLSRMRSGHDPVDAGRESQPSVA